MQPTQTPNSLICVTEKDTAVFWNTKNEVEEQPLITDSEGLICYINGGKIVRLPLEFQPRLVLR